MKNESAIKHQSGYYQGYAEGFNEGYFKAYEHFKNQLLTQQTRIVVTTQENFDRLSNELTADKESVKCQD
jgi:flagellar biosynthesis/type III secretory pathway protein FliH